MQCKAKKSNLSIKNELFYFFVSGFLQIFDFLTYFIGELLF